MQALTKQPAQQIEGVVMCLLCDSNPPKAKPTRSSRSKKFGIPMVILKKTTQAL